MPRSTRSRARWRELLAGAAAVTGLLAAPSHALAAPGADAPTAESVTPIESKYQSLGGPGGVLGAPLDVEHCDPGGCYREFENGEIVQWSGGVRAVTDLEIWDVWAAEGGSAGVYGYPTSDTFCGLRDGGCGQHFERASVYTSPATGAWPVRAYMRGGWEAAGWEHGIGYPVDDEYCGLRDGGCLQDFQRGAVYASRSGTFAVSHGPIGDRWAAQGWEHGQLGYPTSRQFCGLRDGGCGQHFQGGSVYWSPATGARAVLPEGIRRWATLGWEFGQLGYPTSEPFRHQNGGYGQHFQGGSLYAMSGTEIRLVTAPIRDRWGAQRWEHGSLGYPVTDSFCGLRNGGCGQHFSGGSIYWSPSTPAVIVAGGMDDRIRYGWSQRGWETGALGYPTSEMFCGLRDGGCGQHFQGGSLYFSRNTPPTAVSGPFRDRWAAQGWENGRLGYPALDARPIPGGLEQYFNGGRLTLINGQVR